MSSLAYLPREILITLPDFIHNIEDFTNLSSTCRTLRDCLTTASPRTILRLASAQSRIFFRPSPHFLVAATARELGLWARQSPSNEAIFADRCSEGIDGLLDLSLQHCGLTLEQIRHLYSLRFSIINPITDIMDQCIGQQWYSTPNFWEGGVDDAYTIRSDPPATLFHLAIYGELFGPDLDSFLDPAEAGSKRRFSVDTRLEFVKYCIPDEATDMCGGISARNVTSEDGTVDPRRYVKPTGPYVKEKERRYVEWPDNNNVGLTWVLRSTRWRPHWEAVRRLAGPDFKDDFDEGWWYAPDDDATEWRQRLWENVMVCQGLNGLGMIRPEFRGQWVGKVKEWRDKIAALDHEPSIVQVGLQATHEYPFLHGDLRICVSGYVLGT
ncbi:hypothetical protein B9Z65_4087 [Elsinoe australis]|uniref:Uncharacterized protein n=1 Tax=Elsinoe australis TaxID=40998 RepID=A0A2P7Z1T4_9PEZI|nr:hypothetical protein B9Z65_4087 [Elsinoe australis]